MARLPVGRVLGKISKTPANDSNRHKARMKFIIDKLGFEEFKRRVEAEFSVTRKSHEGRSLTPPPGLDIPPQLRQPVRSNGRARADQGNGGDRRAAPPFAVGKLTSGD